jgi:hypothetical protein
MGASLAIYSIDSELQQRVRDIVADGDDDAAADEFVEAVLVDAPHWSAKRGDHKTWDVVHWVLTGRHSGYGTPTMRLFGIPRLPTRELGEWVAMIDAPTTQRFSDALLRVDPAKHRARLERVPDTVYNAVRNPGVLADAKDLITFAEQATEDEHGLLFVLG